MENIFSLIKQWKLTNLRVKNIVSTDDSVKRQITDSISENLTDSDLESSLIFRKIFYVNIIVKFYFTRITLILILYRKTHDILSRKNHCRVQPCKSYKMCLSAILGFKILEDWPLIWSQYPLKPFSQFLIFIEIGLFPTILVHHFGY